MEGLAVFVGSVHGEGRGLSVLRQNRFALSRLAIEVLGVLDGVVVNFLDQHGKIVFARYGHCLPFDRLVGPAYALSFRVDFIDRNGAVRIDGAVVHFRRRSGKFRLREICRPGASEAAGGNVLGENG